ncbi:MAG: FkbM family methyltransferase [Proteobacteria bacterium]|nr:FkbM family methyltransferase [Pseudomonadota bacterium]
MPDAALLPPSLIQALARLTRRCHPKGTDRLLRLVYPPGNDRPIRTLVDYDDGLVLNIDTSSFLEWYIFFYGAFRPEVSKLLNRVLRPGQVAFDIGANIGMHSVIMANRVGPTGRVVCFEPDPHPHGRLVGNLRLNGFGFAETHQAALSARSERRKFFMHDEASGNYANASFYAENVGADTSAIEVEVLSLDDFIARNPVPRLDAIKLLAQGEEWNVLQGGRETIAKFRPKVFFLYEPSYWHRQDLELMDAVKFFADFGYTTYAIEFGPRRAVTGEIAKGQVFLATP